jgi:hypothetical protein
MREARGRRMLVIALVASAAVVGAAVGAAAALRGRRARVAQVASANVAPPAARLPVVSADLPSSEPPATAGARVAAPPRPARAVAKVDPFTAELELLQRAHAAYTRRDFSVALTLVAEHARRFPNGHLAEQREALRVRSLAGAGRADEAHRAAAAFAAQFPRSVLLPRVDGASAEP